MAIFLTILVALLAALGGIYQFLVLPVLQNLGAFREIGPNTGTRHCITVPELSACEDMYLHDSGLLYLTCGTMEDRRRWVAGNDKHAPVGHDYVATYDDRTGDVTRLEFSGFDNSQSWALHGMDVVPSNVDPNVLYVYIVNHLRTATPESPSSNSTIEIFRTTVGGTTLHHLRTVSDPQVIQSPNDVVGSSDGLSFYFTNDDDLLRDSVVAHFRHLFLPASTVGYCHADTGCKIAFKFNGLKGANGIAMSPNGTVYVASCLGDGLSILERRDDHSLAQLDHIQTHIPMDNINIDRNGVIWAAGIPKVLEFNGCLADPTLSTRCPSMALALSINTGPGAFYGDKYKVEEVFTDNGDFVSLMTSVIHDSERRRLYMHGIGMAHLVVCKV